MKRRFGRRRSVRLGCEQLERREMLAVDLAVNVDLPPGDQQPGSEVAFAVHVTNQANDVATGVKLAETTDSVLADLSWSCDDCPSFAVDTPLAEVGQGVQGFLVQGLSSGDLLGSGSDAGDFNGDGISDVLVGAQGVQLNPNDPNTRVGTVYVIFGSNTPFPASFDLATLDGSNGVAIPGMDPQFNVGRVISSAGDINSDGFEDIVIRQDEVYVIYGSDQFEATFDLESLNGTNGFVIAGSNAHDISPAGDFNGDGHDDLVVAGVIGESTGTIEVGYVIFGSDQVRDSVLDVSDLDGSNGFSVQGAGRISAGGGGDVNGDGLDDVVLGSEDSPQVSVLFGTTDDLGESFDTLDLNGENGFVITTQFSVGNGRIAGDVNGDGLADVAFVSGPRQDAVLYGSKDSFDVEIDGTALSAEQGFFINFSGSLSGGSVDAAGDVNGDGLDDLILGRASETVAPSPFPGFGSEGRAYVIFGSSSRPVNAIDTDNLDGSDGFRLNGLYNFGNAGWTVSGAGDVNADGIDDMLVGANTAPETEGLLYVVFGQSNTGLGKLNDLVDIAAGETITYRVRGTVPSDFSGTFTGSISATPNADQPDANNADNTDTYTITVGGEILVGDIDRDGVVGFSDFLILSTNFGRSDDVSWDDGDLNGDGAVGFADFLLLSANFGARRD